MFFMWFNKVNEVRTLLICLTFEMINNQSKTQHAEHVIETKASIYSQGWGWFSEIKE